MAFITPEDRAFMSPSSSPGGSPAASSFIDSSPLSSPSLQTLDLDRPATPLGISHPFSGSTHATAHPSNELRYSNSSYTPATWSYRSGASSADHPKGFESLFHEEEEGFSTCGYDLEPPDEATLWEEKITRAVDMGEAEFTWKDAGLTFIPPSIVELNSLGVISESAQRPFKRVQTAPPAVNSSSHRSFFSQRIPPARTRSQGFMIFLANNEIKTLPQQFFKLSNLTVLSLRNNSLDYLPPEIAQLQVLKDLDVVNNNLRFLPAEMTTMTLTNLNVHTNPWYPVPSNASGPRDAAEIMDSATRVHFCVPPLREVVLRYLLTPAANQQRSLAPSPPISPTTTMMATIHARQPTMLEDRFQLPLQEGTLTPADAELIARLAPAAVSAPRRHALSRSTTSAPGAGLFPSTTSALPSKSERACPTHCSLTGLAATTPQQQYEQKSCSGRCPSPRHNYATPTEVVQQWPWPRLGPPFVMPAEERYTWVTELAGVRVGESTGGVPILWRGCARGCLDFLDQGNTSTAAPVGETTDEKK